MRAASHFDMTRVLGSRARSGLAALLVALVLCGCAFKREPPPVVESPIEEPVPPPSPYPALEERVLATPKEAERSIDSLAAYLTATAKDDREKAWAIFRWTAQNIHYDVKGFFSGDYGELSPDAVLSRRSAVCDGYSSLFESLAKAAGLEAVHILGFAKGVGFAAGMAVPERNNHAWNAVFIDGRWVLVDCTWAAGSLNEEGQYEQVFEPYYFDPRPDELIRTHFPVDPRWQLLPRPVTRAEFESGPLLKTAFFTAGLRLGNFDRATIVAPEPELDVNLVGPADTHIMASLVNAEDEALPNATRVVREGEAFHISVVLPAPGDYTLRVFVKKGNPEGIHQWALDYLVRAKQGTSKTIDEWFAPPKKRR
jgi:hypothetical protein